MSLSPQTKQKLAVVLNVSKVVFHWGFIPAVLYLGFQKGADPGMPELSFMQYVSNNASINKEKLKVLLKKLD